VAKVALLTLAAAPEDDAEDADDDDGVATDELVEAVADEPRDALVAADDDLCAEEHAVSRVTHPIRATPVSRVACVLATRRLGAEVIVALSSSDPVLDSVREAKYRPATR
jgi:hypothetical protein